MVYGRKNYRDLRQHNVGNFGERTVNQFLRSDTISRLWTQNFRQFT